MGSEQQNSIFLVLMLFSCVAGSVEGTTLTKCGILISCYQGWHLQIIMDNFELYHLGASPFCCSTLASELCQCRSL